MMVSSSYYNYGINISSINNFAGLQISSGSKNNFYDLFINDSIYGLSLWTTNNNTIVGGSILNNHKGIYILFGNNNILRNIYNFDTNKDAVSIQNGYGNYFYNISGANNQILFNLENSNSNIFENIYGNKNSYDFTLYSSNSNKFYHSFFSTGSNGLYFSQSSYNYIDNLTVNNKTNPNTGGITFYKNSNFYEIYNSKFELNSKAIQIAGSSYGYIEDIIMNGNSFGIYYNNSNGLNNNLNNRVYIFNFTGGGTGVRLSGSTHNSSIFNGSIANSGTGIRIESLNIMGVPFNSRGSYFENVSMQTLGYGIDCDYTENSKFKHFEMYNVTNGVVETSDNSHYYNFLLRNGTFGFRSEDSNDIFFENITVLDYRTYGFKIFGSRDVLMRNSNFSGNKYNFGIEELPTRSQNMTYFSTLDIDLSNKIDYNYTLYYVKNLNDMNFDRFIIPDAGAFYAVNFTNVNFTNLNFSHHNEVGLFIGYSKNIGIDNIYYSTNFEGLKFLYTYNSIVNSSLSEFNEYGYSSLYSYYNIFDSLIGRNNSDSGFDITSGSRFNQVLNFTGYDNNIGFKFSSSYRNNLSLLTAYDNNYSLYFTSAHNNSVYNIISNSSYEPSLYMYRSDRNNITDFWIHNSTTNSIFMEGSEYNNFTRGFVNATKGGSLYIKVHYFLYECYGWGTCRNYKTANNNFFRDINFLNESYSVIRTEGDAHCYMLPMNYYPAYNQIFLNTSYFNDSVNKVSSLHRRWYVDVFINQSNGSIVPYAKVDIFDRNSSSYLNVHSNLYPDYESGFSPDESYDFDENATSSFILEHYYKYNLYGGSTLTTNYNNYTFHAYKNYTGEKYQQVNVSGNLIQNDTVIITLNGKPIINVSILTDSGFESYYDDLKCYVNVTDYNNNTVDLYYFWYNGSNIFSSGNLSNVNLSTPFLLTTLNHTHTKYNERWNCSVYGYDGIDNGFTYNASVLTKNYAPIARDDWYYVRANNDAYLDVLTNDSDFEMDPLTLLFFTLPSHGTIGGIVNGTHVRFIPQENFTGYTTFTYTIRDVLGLQDTATVNLSVVNNKPIVQNVFINSSTYTTYKNENLRCYARIFDINKDNVYVNFTWYKNNVSFSSGQVGPFASGTLNLVDTVSNLDTDVGDNWTCSVIGYDGDSYGDNYTNSSYVNILDYNKVWNEILVPGGIFEPDTGTYYSGTHVDTFSIYFVNLTLNSDETLRCEVQMSNQSTRIISQTGITRIQQNHALDYTVQTTDSIIFDNGGVGYIPWVLKRCYIVSSNNQKLYQQDYQDLANLNKSVRIHVHNAGYWGDNEVTATVSCINNPGKYFNNTQKCTFSGDTMFALQMRNGNPVNTNCYNYLVGGCPDSLCTGLTFPQCGTPIFHSGFNFSTVDPNGYVFATENVVGASGTFNPQIAYSQFTDSSTSFKLRFYLPALGTARPWTITIVNMSNVANVSLYGPTKGNGNLQINPGPSPGTYNINYENLTTAAYSGGFDFVFNITLDDPNMNFNTGIYLTIGIGLSSNAGTEVWLPVSFDSIDGYNTGNESQGLTSIHSIDAGNRCGDRANNDFDYVLGAIWGRSYDCFDPDCDNISGDYSQTNEFGGGRTGLCNYKNETICNDQFDNDYDYLAGTDFTDCHDSDCFQNSIHCPSTETICYDGVNNDWDYTRGESTSDTTQQKIENNNHKYDNTFRFALQDCEDLDCNNQIGNNVTNALCNWGHEINCSDGFNNDGLQLKDCEMIPVANRRTLMLNSMAEYNCAVYCRANNGSTTETGLLCEDNLDNDWDDITVNGYYDNQYVRNTTNGAGIDCRWGGYFGIGTNYQPDENCNGQMMSLGRCELQRELNCTDGFDNDIDFDAVGMPRANWSLNPVGYFISYGINYLEDADFDDYDCSRKQGALINESVNASFCTDGVDNDLDNYYFTGANYALNNTGGGFDCSWGGYFGYGPNKRPDLNCDGITLSNGFECQLRIELNCTDGYDNDFDRDATSMPNAGWSANTTAYYMLYGINYSNDADFDDYDCKGKQGAILNESVEPTFCFDGIDNDLDARYFNGLVWALNTSTGFDCEDPDCLGVTVPSLGLSCLSNEYNSSDPYYSDLIWPGMFCANTFDDDADGATDCSDSDCFGKFDMCTRGPCFDVEDVLWNTCFDGLDNDFSGGLDCADTDCLGMLGSSNGGLCQATETSCDDGVDNDGDGLIDKLDPNCVGRVSDNLNFTGVLRQSTETSCFDNYDNDNDGLYDCYDSHCNAACSMTTIVGANPISLPIISGSVNFGGATASITQHTNQVRQGEIYRVTMRETGASGDVQWTIGTAANPFEIANFNISTAVLTGANAGSFTLTATENGWTIDELSAHPAGYTIVFEIRSRTALATTTYEMTFADSEGAGRSFLPFIMTYTVRENVAPVVSQVRVSPANFIEIGQPMQIRAQATDNSAFARCIINVTGPINGVYTENDCAVSLNPTVEGNYNIKVMPTDLYYNNGSLYNMTHYLNILPTKSTMQLDNRFFTVGQTFDVNATFNVPVSDSLGSCDIYAQKDGSTAVYLTSFGSTGNSCVGSNILIPLNFTDSIYKVYAIVTETTEGNRIVGESDSMFVCSQTDTGVCALADFNADTFADSCGFPEVDVTASLSYAVIGEDNVKVTWYAIDDNIDVLHLYVYYPNGTVLYHSSSEYSNVILDTSDLTAQGIYTVDLYVKDYSKNVGVANTSFTVGPEIVVSVPSTGGSDSGSSSSSSSTSRPSSSSSYFPSSSSSSSSSDYRGGPLVCDSWTDYECDFMGSCIEGIQKLECYCVDDNKSRILRYKNLTCEVSPSLNGTNITFRKIDIIEELGMATYESGEVYFSSGERAILEKLNTNVYLANITYEEGLVYFSQEVEDRSVVVDELTKKQYIAEYVDYVDGKKLYKLIDFYESDVIKQIKWDQRKYWYYLAGFMTLVFCFAVYYIYRKKKLGYEVVLVEKFVNHKKK